MFDPNLYVREVSLTLSDHWHCTTVTPEHWRLANMDPADSLTPDLVATYRDGFVVFELSNELHIGARHKFPPLSVTLQDLTAVGALPRVSGLIRCDRLTHPEEAADAIREHLISPYIVSVSRLLPSDHAAIGRQASRRRTFSQLIAMGWDSTDEPYGARLRGTRFRAMVRGDSTVEISDSKPESRSLTFDTCRLSGARNLRKLTSAAISQTAHA